MSYEQLSWRDPDGIVVRLDDRILRAVSLEKAEQTRALLRAPWMVRLIADGAIPQTEELPVPPHGLHEAPPSLWLEHQRLEFPSYPHEITALQLYDAAHLTLKIAVEAARDGWTLKDASAWNVLFSRGRPVFVDLLSFEKQRSARTWTAYGQFVRHFLLPLMLHHRLGLTPPEIFLINRDGIAPERAHRMLSGRSLLSAMAIELVLLPKWLAPAGGRLIEAQTTAKAPPVRESAFAGGMLLRTLARLQRMLDKLRPDVSRAESVWKGYEEDRSHYTDLDLAAKTAFVKAHLAGARSVLDLGANAGEFSLLACAEGATVIAADSDHPALSRLYGRIRGSEHKITPMLLNIGRPTAAVGWQNREVPSFIERAAGKFDCILVLGLIHHLIVSERATVAVIADLLHQLNPKTVILEWVDPADPKFRQIAGLNIGLYAKLSVGQLEHHMGQKFALRSKTALPCGTRVMYLWQR